MTVCNHQWADTWSHFALVQRVIHRWASCMSLPKERSTDKDTTTGVVFFHLHMPNIWVFFSFTLDGEKLDCYLHFTNWKQTPKQKLMNRCSESFKGLPRVCGYDSAKSEAPGSLMFSPPNCLDIHFIPVKVKAQGCWRSRAVQSKSRWLELWIYYQVIMKAKER